MKSILHKRILDLGRGEDGVALVVTLAVFMFMYIFCAGVFAVGKMVKDRICLQNAADAAAYSAAVVQADTLSRIATINRAMSWTYAQMNKRRMDFIVYRWMEHAKLHYARDREEAASWVAGSLKHSPHYKNRNVQYHGGFHMEAMQANRCIVGDRLPVRGEVQDSLAVQYGNREMLSPAEKDVVAGLSGFRNYLGRTAEIVGSCYDMGGKSGIEGLEYQINADMEAIDRMNMAELDLRQKMKGRIETAAKEILRANVPDFGTCAYVVKSDSGTGFLVPMRNTASQEYRFHEWGNRDIPVRRYWHWSAADEDAWCFGRWRTIYGEGAGSWFKSEWQSLPTSARSGVGFRWQYTGELSASWTWSAWRCEGCRYLWDVRHERWIYTGFQKIVRGAGSCDHVASSRHDEQFGGACTGTGGRCTTLGSVLRGYRDENGILRNYSWILDCRYKSDKGSRGLSANNSGRLLWARPHLLTEDFFGSKGTITVGVARPNANPWRDQYVMGDTRNQPSNIGLYHAFDPFLDWMVCFASARAGYKAVIDDVDRELENRYCRARVENGLRDYCIDFKPCCGVARKVEDRYDERYGWYKHVELVLPSWRQRWNLCQSDWDAVMIPVCRGGSGVFENLDTDFTYSYLREPCWEKTVSSYLEDLVTGVWNGPEDGSAFAGNWYRFEAGNAHSDAIHGYGPLAHPDGDLSMLLNQLPERYHGWTSDVVQRGGTHAVKWPYQWRVSVPGGRLNWLELQKQMLH